MAASRTPQLDSFLKSEVSPATKTTDKELASIQTYVLDALAPLSAILPGPLVQSSLQISIFMATCRAGGSGRAARAIALPLK